MVWRIQSAMVSTREVVSSWSCGQSGPSCSTATSSGAWWSRSRKYGAPESYRQALVVGSGLNPRTPTVLSVKLDILTWPVRSRVLGIGSAASAVPTVAVVGYGTGPLTRLRSTSWKQWPAVMIHRCAIRAPEQALLYWV